MDSKHCKRAAKFAVTSTERVRRILIVSLKCFWVVPLSDYEIEKISHGSSEALVDIAHLSSMVVATAASLTLRFLLEGDESEWGMAVGN